MQLLEKASRDAQKSINDLVGKQNISSKVERTRLAQVQAQIQRLLEKIWSDIGDNVRAAQARAAALALESSFDWDETLLRSVYPDRSTRETMRAYLASSADRNLQAAFARNDRAIPLSVRVYRSRNLNTGYVDRLVNSALARGINYRQFAQEIQSSIRPDAPGGVAYAAKRLARTEINRAYHLVTVQDNADKPWATGMVWATSRSHPSPDLCDEYASRSPFPLDDVPEKPHPQCMCYTYPDLITREQFVANWRAGVYDGYIAANYGVA